MSKIKSVKSMNKYVPASLWKRFFAYLIDMFVITFVLSLSFAGYFGDYNNALDILFILEDPKFFWISFIVILSVIFYHSVLEYKTSQTLGKMIFNIYTISILNNKLTFNQALLRNITKPFSIVLLVDVIYLFFKGANRRLFEVFSRTMVVEKEMVFK